jgi:hypothetical protein
MKNSLRLNLPALVAFSALVLIAPAAWGFFGTCTVECYGGSSGDGQYFVPGISYQECCSGGPLTSFQCPGGGTSYGTAWDGYTQTFCGGLSVEDVMPDFLAAAPATTTN